MSNLKNAYSRILAAILLWSTVASVFKLALKELDYIQILFFASFSSTAVLAVIILLQKKIPFLIKQTRLDIIKSAGIGFLNPFLYYMALFKAYSLLPAQEAQPLNWTWPIALTLLSAPILRQKLRFISVIGIFVSFTGVLVISTGGIPWDLHFTNLTGDIMAVSSSIIWAAYWIINLKDRREPVIKLFMGFVFGTFYSLTALLLMTNFETANISGLAFTVYIGLFEMGLTFIIWLKALEIAGDNASVANYAYLTPFISLIFIHYIVGETIQISSITGLTLIIGGILIGSVRRKYSSDALQ